MSQVPDTFVKSIDKVLEVVMFENWLRFYFISEEDASDKLFILVPEQGMKRIKELYPHLSLLAENVNAKEITFDSSRSAVCEHVIAEVDGKTIPKEMSTMVFDSITFQIELQLFNTWVSAHEEQLDESFLEFGAWRNFFSQWRQTDGVKEIAVKMMHAASTGPEAENSGTVH